MLQNRPIRNQWLSLDIKNHYESTVGKRWGIGFRIPHSVRAVEEGKDLERNLFGAILDKLYTEFKNGIWNINTFPENKYIFTVEIIAKGLKNISSLNIDQHLIEKERELIEINGKNIEQSEVLIADETSNPDYESSSEEEVVETETTIGNIVANGSTENKGKSPASNTVTTPSINQKEVINNKEGGTVKVTQNKNTTESAVLGNQTNLKVSVPIASGSKHNSPDKPILSSVISLFNKNPSPDTSKNNNLIDSSIRKDDNSPLKQRQPRRRKTKT